MTAVKYLLDNGLGDLVLNEREDKENWIYASDIMQQYAEAYHEAKVESITDEDIKHTAIYRTVILSNQEPFKEGARWLKSQLLK